MIDTIVATMHNNQPQGDLFALIVVKKKEYAVTRIRRRYNDPHSRSCAVPSRTLHELTAARCARLRGFGDYCGTNISRLRISELRISDVDR